MAQNFGVYTSRKKIDIIMLYTLPCNQSIEPITKMAIQPPKENDDDELFYNFMLIVTFALFIY